MKKILLLFILITMAVFSGCNTTFTAENYQLLQDGSSIPVTTLDLTSGQPISIDLNLLVDYVENPTLVVENTGDDIGIEVAEDSFTITPSGDSSGELVVTVLSDKFEPISSNIAWTSTLLTQEVGFVAAPVGGMSASILDPETPLTNELIDGAVLYDGDKQILKQRLANGEQLTGETLASGTVLITYEQDKLWAVVGQRMLFELSADEDATISVLPDSDIVAVSEQNGVWTIDAQKAGKGAVTITVEKEHRKPFTKVIEIEVSDPPTLLELMADDVSMEIGKAQQVGYIVYPADATVAVSIQDESVATVAQTANSLTVSSVKVGETDIVLEVVAEGYASTEKTLPTTITPTKTSLGITSPVLKDGVLTATVMTSYDVNVAIAADAVLEISYLEDKLEISQDGKITIKPVDEGDFEVTFSVTQEGYYANEQTIIVRAKKEPVNISVDKSEVTANDIGLEPVVKVASTNADIKIDIETTDGVTADYNTDSKELYISATKDGTVSVIASAQGYSTVTKQIKVTHNEPVASVKLSQTAIDLNGWLDVKNIQLSFPQSPVPTVEISASEGITAQYNQNNTTLSISGDRDGTVTVSTELKGYLGDSEKINVTYYKPTVSVSLGSSTVTVDGIESVNVPLRIQNADNAEVTVTATNNASATYNANSGNINIFAEQDATVSVTVSAEGYTPVTKNIEVRYEAPSISTGENDIYITAEAGTTYYVPIHYGGMDVQVDVSTAGNVTAKYYNDEVEINATGEGKVTVTASKEGYNPSIIVIHVDYKESTPLDTNQSSMVNEVLRLVNIERANAGVHALTLSSTLTNYAQIRADELQATYSHDRPNGDAWHTVLGNDASGRSAAENIAQGHRSAQEVVDGWMNSEGHKKNILNDAYDQLGVGISSDSSGRLSWCQLFWSN